MRQRHSVSRASLSLEGGGNADVLPPLLGPPAAAAPAAARTSSHHPPPRNSPPSRSSSSSSGYLSSSTNDVDSALQDRRAGARASFVHSIHTAASAAAPAVAEEEPAGGRGVRTKRWIKKNLIPQFVFEYGRTVYGGNPLVQQTLPGFFNYPSPFVLVPLFFLLMVPFIVMGVGILTNGSKHRPVEVPYSQIRQYQYVPSDPRVNINEGLRNFTVEGKTFAQGSRTWLEVDVANQMEAPVLMYYKIYNMYQNFRDFHNGRSIPQLLGKKNIGDSYTCLPFTYPGYREDSGATPITVTDASGKAVTRPARDFTYNPCGMGPWSMFNDSFVLYRKLSAEEVAEEVARGVTVLYSGANGTTPVRLICNGTDFGPKGEPLGGSIAVNHCAKKGISWKADEEIRFQNLTLRDDWWSLYYPLPTTNEYLRNGWYLYEAGHALPDPSDYDLQVWMRAAFLSTFKKLYRIIDIPLTPGTYLVDISEFYDVVSFRGRKSIVLQHPSWSGSHSIVLGIGFVIMGGLSFVLGVAFTVECLLQRHGVNRYEHLTEPKRSWYVFPPSDLEFARYYQLRLRRHIPVAQLQSLRHAVAELESQAGAPPAQQQGYGMGRVGGSEVEMRRV